MVLGQKECEPQHSDHHDTLPSGSFAPAHSSAGTDLRPTDLSRRLLLDRRTAPAHWLLLGYHELAQYGFHLEVLDNVTRLDVVKVLESDTAFITRQHLTCIIFEAAERADFAFPNYTAIAHETGARV